MLNGKSVFLTKTIMKHYPFWRVIEMYEQKNTKKCFKISILEGLSKAFYAKH